MPLSAVLALALAGPGLAADPAASTAPAVGAFDGERLGRGGLALPALAGLRTPDGKIDFCAPQLLAADGLPRGAFSLEPSLTCAAPQGADALSRFVALASPGGEAGGFASRGLRRELAARARSDDFRKRLRRFYGAVREADKRAEPKPGWAWPAALEAAGGEPATALRLAAFCGRDEAEAPELPEPRAPAEARSALASFKETLQRYLDAAGGEDDKSWARQLLGAAREEDFSDKLESVCPPPASFFHAVDGLGAGVKGPPRRGYAGALLACELAGLGAGAALAERAAANAAWVDRLLRINAEAAMPPEARPFSGGLLGDLAPARTDAFALLAAWDADAPFPGPHRPPRPAGWTPERYAAAAAKLDRLGRDWRGAVDDYAAGARFGARVCGKR